MLGEQNGFDVDTTNNSSLFTINNLKQYLAVVFLSTTGDVLNDKQQNAFINYIRTGKGLLEQPNFFIILLLNQLEYQNELHILGEFFYVLLVYMV